MRSSVRQLLASNLLFTAAHCAGLARDAAPAHRPHGGSAVSGSRSHGGVVQAPACSDVLWVVVRFAAELRPAPARVDVETSRSPDRGALCAPACFHITSVTPQISNWVGQTSAGTFVPAKDSPSILPELLRHQRRRAYSCPSPTARPEILTKFLQSETYMRQNFVPPERACHSRRPKSADYHRKYSTNLTCPDQRRRFGQVLKARRVRIRHPPIRGGLLSRGPSG